MVILIDKRIQKYVKGFLYGDNDEVISIHLNDIDETFWFDSEVEAQEFMNKQAIERVGYPDLRKNSFDYVDEEGLLHRYSIMVNRKGMITSYKEEVIYSDKKRELNLENIFKGYDMGNATEEFDWGLPVGNEIW